jgi:hypothetical protein
MINQEIVQQLELIKLRPTNVSSRYQSIDTLTLLQDTLQLLTKLGYSDCPIKVLKPHGKSTTHYVEIRLNDSLVNIDGGLIPKLYLRNSYNGECSASIQIGILRLVCSNGLMLGTNYFQMNITHLVGSKFEDTMNTIPYVIPAALAEVENMHKRVKELSFQTLSIPEQIQIVEALPISNRIAQLALNKLWQQANGYLRSEDTPRNVWTLWNIVNESIGQYSRREYSTVEKNVNLIDSIEATLNQLRAA